MQESLLHCLEYYSTTMTQLKFGTTLPARHLIDAPLLLIQVGANHINELTLLAPEIAKTAQPGQFLEILFGDNYSPLVRRPFSIYDVDREAGTIDILFRSSGSFTNSLGSVLTSTSSQPSLDSSASSSGNPEGMGPLDSSFVTGSSSLQTVSGSFKRYLVNEFDERV